MTQQTPVTVTDIRIPFLRLVMFFIKAGLAAIPAVIIVVLIVSFLAIALAAVFGGSPTFVIRQWM